MLLNCKIVPHHRTCGVTLYLGFCGDFQELTNNGFSAEPDTISRLHSREQTTITITAKQEKAGDVAVPLILSVSSNITYEVLLKAKFVVPDLQFSAEKLQFGGVRRGATKSPSTFLSTSMLALTTNSTILSPL